MRLGFWNRLAVVIAALALIIAPAAFWLQRLNAYGDTKSSLHDICMLGPNEALENGDYEGYVKGKDACRDEFYGRPDTGWPSWGVWWVGVQGTALALVALYLLALLAAVTGKWVWRGRVTNGSGS